MGKLEIMYTFRPCEAEQEVTLLTNRSYILTFRANQHRTPEKMLFKGIQLNSSVLLFVSDKPVVSWMESVHEDDIAQVVPVSESLTIFGEMNLDIGRWYDVCWHTIHLPDGLCTSRRRLKFTACEEKPGIERAFWFYLPEGELIRIMESDLKTLAQR